MVKENLLFSRYVVVFIRTENQKPSKIVYFCKKYESNLHILSAFVSPASFVVSFCLYSVCFETRPESHGAITLSFPPIAPSSRHPDEGLLNNRSLKCLTVSHSGRFLHELPKII